MAALTTTVADLSQQSVRDLNSALHQASSGTSWSVTHPDGAHNLAVGLTAALDVVIDGPAGYYCAGMNQRATVTVHGNVGPGVAENMMSGTVRVRGSASQSAGATAHGGLLVIEGNASARCGISMKGVDIVVGGNVGHMSAFMGQSGRLVVCGDAGDALGDSLYEARLYVQGKVKSLGADCVEKEMRDEHLAELAELLKSADRDDDPAGFRRYGSARELYHFKVDNSSSY
ncbi:glutamate synthase [Streptomyces sporangiiformans]|uniref:Glutamate synthase n=1 Tax=Streptomyces sporangiiformans TaxID=2315329 RepID=A0A505DNV1_9ACTN|nr:glutamate synthase [Streptomyces sporangiiformans]TPQ22915.1 glutamate synthase [Streptomyces sporangiiformans]